MPNDNFVNVKHIVVSKTLKKMCKVGSKGSPTANSFKLAAKTAKKVKKKTA